MKKIAKPIQVQFKFKNISLLSHALDLEKIAQPIDTSKFIFEYKVKMNISFQEDVISFEFRLKLRQESKYVGSLVTSMGFTIKELKNFPKEGKSVLLPDPFVFHLLGLVISTNRGIWASIVIGTQIESVILPLIDTKKLVDSLKQSMTQPTRKNKSAIKNEIK